MPFAPTIKLVYRSPRAAEVEATFNRRHSTEDGVPVLPRPDSLPTLTGTPGGPLADIQEIIREGIERSGTLGGEVAQITAEIDLTPSPVDASLYAGNETALATVTFERFVTDLARTLQSGAGPGGVSGVVRFSVAYDSGE